MLLAAALAPQLVAAPLQVHLVVVDLRAEVVFGELGPPGPAPPLVLRLEHLVEVVQLELDLVLV